MKIIISESQYNFLQSKYQKIQEQESPLERILRLAATGGEEESESDSENDTMVDTTLDTTYEIEPGGYYVNPNYQSVNIKYYPNAIPLNKDAETLLKSIAKDIGKSEITVSSTLRTYEDQARVNKQNSRKNIINWYCRGNKNCDLVKKWDLFKSGQMTQQEYADYLKERDRERGKVMSNHIPGFSIDVVPYDENLATKAEKLSKQSNSGVKNVVREPDNNAVHLDFTFKVTGQSGVKSPTIKKVEKDSLQTIKKDNIIIDTKDNTSETYALIYGGYPSSQYGAKFMYDEGKQYIKRNVVYADKELSIESVENELKKINPNAKIDSVSGFSGGGSNTLRALDSGKYKFIGLIDPYITSERTSLPSNVKMISRSENWTGYPNVKKVLAKMENSGESEKVGNSYNHEKMPEIFFQKYGNLV